MEPSDRGLRRGVTWNLIPVALLAVVGLGMNLTIGGAWGEAALGVFNQVTTAYFVVAVLGAFGINFSVIRAIAERPSDRARVAAIVVGGLVPVGVLATTVTIAFVAVRWHVADLLGSPRVATGMSWIAPAVFCFSINKLLLGVVNGLGRMRAFALYTSLRYVGLAVALAVAHWRDFPAEQLPVLWTVAEGLVFAVLVVELVATVPLSRAAGWTRWTRAHLGYGARGVVATLMFEISSRLDVWMLGAAMSDARVGVYSMAASIAEGVLQLAVVLQVNVNPRIAALIATGQIADYEALVRRSRRWFVPAFGAVCVLGAALFPLAIPTLTGNQAYIDGAAPFAILMGGIALASPYLPFNQTLLMASRPGWHTLYVVLAVAFNVTLNAVLIPRLELEGAAIATACGLVGSALLLRLLVRVRVGATI